MSVNDVEARGSAPDGPAIISGFLESRVPGLQAGFGLSRVPADRVLPGPARLVAAVRQVHGIRVIHVDRIVDAGGEAAAALAATEADALVTRHPGVALAARTADCVPLLLVDRRGQGCAAVHAGWRGTVDGVVGAAVTSLAELTGGAPGDLLAEIGPCIGPCCFEVGEEVAVHFGPDQVLRRPGRDRPHVDLPGAVRQKLLEQGVPAASVAPYAEDRPPACTSCQPGRFASYRRATRAGRPLEGYQFSVIMLGPAAP